jgi:hypothetical protein
LACVAMPVLAKGIAHSDHTCKAPQPLQPTQLLQQTPARLHHHAPPCLPRCLLLLCGHTRLHLHTMPTQQRCHPALQEGKAAPKPWNGPYRAFPEGQEPYRQYPGIEVAYDMELSRASVERVARTQKMYFNIRREVRERADVAASSE